MGIWEEATRAFLGPLCTVDGFCEHSNPKIVLITFHSSRLCNELWGDWERNQDIVPTQHISRSYDLEVVWDGNTNPCSTDPLPVTNCRRSRSWLWYAAMDLETTWRWNWTSQVVRRARHSACLTTAPYVSLAAAGGSIHFQGIQERVHGYETIVAVLRPPLQNFCQFWPTLASGSSLGSDFRIRK